MAPAFQGRRTREEIFVGAASLVLGILTLLHGLLPVYGMFSFPYAVTGFILGFVDWRRNKRADAPRGLGVAGMILNALAVLFILTWLILLIVLWTQPAFREGFLEQSREILREPGGEPVP